MVNQVQYALRDIRDAFFDELYDIAVKDRSVVFLTADMGALSLEKFKKNLPAQYINVGISEQNLVSVAAGLALAGKKVFIYAIASFITHRCFEQIRIDLCGMNLPVVIIGSGPGICYGSDGSTHHAVEDIALMRVLPNISILNPSDPVSASAAAGISYQSNVPVYVRLDKGKLPLIYPNTISFSEGLSLLKKGQDLLIITTGVMVHNVCALAQELAKRSIDAGILDVYRIKPLNETLLLSYLRTYRTIVTVEEHSIVGGIGSAICELVADQGISVNIRRFAIPIKNCEHFGDRQWMHHYYGLDIQTMADKIFLDN